MVVGGNFGIRSTSVEPEVPPSSSNNSLTVESETTVFSNVVQIVKDKFRRTT
jgi:hypothetical protein